MGSFTEVGKTGDLQNGSKKKVTVQGQEIMLARVGDKYYATGNRCAHMGGDLSAGKLEGTIVTCPRHGSQFDVRDGRNLVWIPRITGLSHQVAEILRQPHSLRVYTVALRDGQVWVDLEP